MDDDIERSSYSVIEPDRFYFLLWKCIRIMEVPYKDDSFSWNPLQQYGQCLISLSEKQPKVGQQGWQWDTHTNKFNLI